ncbi:MAG: hypothetical protein CFE32_18595 [Alphaproteobacteria bacterium PA3]|nr:MAG: hypothetical protein CFE32_18595 [Alphaproteobacteria bacterium PA3]
MPFNPVTMFKAFVLQTLCLSSEKANELQFKDRLSFQRFLGLGLNRRMPDATTSCSLSS